MLVISKPWFNVFQFVLLQDLKTRTYHQLNKHNTTSYNTLSHNDLVWFKLMHSCMHTCLCLIHFELVCLCLYVCVFTRLWRGSELHLWLLCLYWLLWSSRQVTLISQLYFLYALVFSISMHDRNFVFQVYTMLRTPSSV